MAKITYLDKVYEGNKISIVEGILYIDEFEIIECDDIETIQCNNKIASVVIESVCGFTEIGTVNKALIFSDGCLYADKLKGNLISYDMGDIIGYNIIGNVKNNYGIIASNNIIGNVTSDRGDIIAEYIEGTVQLYKGVVFVAEDIMGPNIEREIYPDDIEFGESDDILTIEGDLDSLYVEHCVNIIINEVDELDHECGDLNVKNILCNLEFNDGEIFINEIEGDVEIEYADIYSDLITGNISTEKNNIIVSEIKGDVLAKRGDIFTLQKKFD